MIWLYGALVWMALVAWGLCLLRIGALADQAGREQAKSRDAASLIG